MLQFIIAGLAIGGIYAITACGLVLTYQSAGVINFSFGAIAFTVARFYYFLNTQHAWPIVPAAVLSLAVLGPIMGLLLYGLVFRFLSQSSTVIRIMATIGISVALPPLDNLIFGNAPIPAAPGLAPEPVKVFHLLGVGVTLDQVIVYIAVVLLLGVGYFVIQYTDIGLRIRAIVDSPAMASLSGTNPRRISMGVWAVSCTLAGLAGVLVAPINGLDPSSMSLLMATAFAAVVAAKLRSQPIAAGVGILMGVADAVMTYYLPPSATWTTEVLVGVPLFVIVICLVYYSARGENLDDAQTTGGALDRAIRPQGADVVSAGQGAGADRLSWRPSAFGLICLLGLPLLLHGYWIGLVGEGIAYGVIFLAFSLTTGEGGMVWFCQATFAGGGGMLAALIAHDYGVPIMLAIVIGGLFAVPFGILVALLTVRMGNLYIALVTLTIGLYVDNSVFTNSFGYNNNNGVAVSPPHFAGSATASTYLVIGIFVVISLLVANLRRSTTGLGLTAVRSSPIGARTLGISVMQSKVVLAGIAAFVAGIGGGLLALTLGTALLTNYSALGGEVWLAVLVTQGIRSNGAAALAGLAQTLFAGFSLVFLPSILGNFVPILFGLGALAMVKFPDGVITMQARQFRSVFATIRNQNPDLYRAIKAVGVAYLIGFVALVKLEVDLWWLWLAITAALGHLVAGYLIGRGVKSQNARGEVIASVPDQAPQKEGVLEGV